MTTQVLQKDNSAQKMELNQNERELGEIPVQKFWGESTAPSIMNDGTDQYSLDLNSYLWLTEIRHLINEDVDEAILEIHSKIDNLLCDGEFSKCNRILKYVDPQEDSVDIVYSFLVATYPAADELDYRQTFFAKAKDRLKNYVSPNQLIEDLE